jgi:hypothetical protein
MIEFRSFVSRWDKLNTYSLYGIVEADMDKNVYDKRGY